LGANIIIAYCFFPVKMAEDIAKKESNEQNDLLQKIDFLSLFLPAKECTMLLLSTAYFPPVEYFVHLVKIGKVEIDLNETYPKQTWRNRCAIMSGNGLVNLVVPVEKPMGNHTPTHAVLFSNHSKWQQIHWKSITSAYRSSPYFLYYADIARHILLEKKFERLAEMNKYILQELCKEMSLVVEITYPESFIEPGSHENDLRFSLCPKPINYQGKKHLTLEPYYQVFEDRFGFNGEISLLDLLFNLGPDAGTYLHEMSEKL
jgi:hypothetical protein